MNLPESIHFVISEAVRFVTPIGLAFEWIVVAACTLVIVIVPLAWTKPLAGLAHWYQGLATRTRLSMLLCALLPVALRLLLLPVAPVPEPSIHDEFSQLLLGDTLAHGRLANPTPAMWEQLQSIHIIQRPTYASMYPPGQGAFLAAGQVIFRQPWAGVEVSIALMCAAMYWMFVAWLPKGWALFGLLVTVIKLTLVGVWVNSYISAAVPTIGGALVVGALPRLRSDLAGARDSVLFGVGAVILMYSRPFEGALLTATVLILLLPSLLRKLGQLPFVLLRQLVLPAAAILLLGAGWLGYYNYRVTGHASELPYQVNRATYGWPENLAFLPPEKISLKDPVLQSMYDLETSRHGIYTTPESLQDNLVTRLFDNWSFLIGPLLTLPLLLGLFRPGKRMRELVLLLAVLLIANLFQLVLYPYHLAPVVPILFCLVAAGCEMIYRALRDFSPGRNLLFAVIVPISLLLITGVKQFGDELGIPASSYWERGYEWHRDARADIVDWLRHRPGKQLVLVRYAANHPVNQEWVYNGADLKDSKIIWGRQMDDESNLKLLKYYSDRHAWLVEADVYPQRVVPYPVGASAPAIDKCSPCRTISESQSQKTAVR